jgi:hypothetical protein
LAMSDALRSWLRINFGWDDQDWAPGDIQF